MRKKRKHDILSNIILPVCLTILNRKLFFATVFFSSLDLSAATSTPDCYREPCTYQVGHIIQVIRALESNIESTQDLLPPSPNGTVWVHKPLESIQPVNHRYIRVDFQMTPTSEERAFLILHPPHAGLVQIDRVGVNTYFFELRPLKEVLGLEIEVRSDLRKIQDLNKEELRRLSPEMIHLIWWDLASRQLPWLTVEQLNFRLSRGGLSYFSFYKVNLTQEQVVGVTRENVRNALDKFDIYRWWRWFSEEQISWLTEDQLRNLVLGIESNDMTETTKGISILEKIQLKWQMNQFSEEQISGLTADELRELVLNLRQNKRPVLPTTLWKQGKQGKKSYP